VSAAGIRAAPRRRRFGRAARILWAARQIARHRLGAPACVILGLLVLAAILAPWITRHDPTSLNYDHVLAPPSAQFWFGTDEIGRDLFARVVYGARLSLQIVAVSIGLAASAGAVIGLLTGYVGGWVDDLAMRIMDGILAFPMLILALGIIAVLGPDLVNAMIAIAIVNVPGFARLVRGQVLSIREQDYVQAARALGQRHGGIIFRHIWPGVVGSLLVYGSLRASAALIAESSLAFLGLGVQPPAPSWGYMLSVSTQFWDAWWLSLFPGAAIFLTVLALNFFGDALRDVLDTRITQRPATSEEQERG
jgi:peptide/nickel transport system permease protein